jgi:hypothetical protein
VIPQKHTIPTCALSIVGKLSKGSSILVVIKVWHKNTEAHTEVPFYNNTFAKIEVERKRLL